MTSQQNVKLVGGAQSEEVHQWGHVLAFTGRSMLPDAADWKNFLCHALPS